jgi:hypothetical protein
LTSWHWLALLGVVAAPFSACGPDHRPEKPCDGPSFNLVITTETGAPLPPDTRISVRYGGNPDGEPYELGKPRTPQAVSCVEDSAVGGRSSSSAASEAGQGGAQATDSAGQAGIVKLSCGLYTQGPARLDVTATGYEPIEDLALSFEDRHHCKVDEPVILKPQKPDAGT